MSEPKDPKRRAIISETLPAPTPASGGALDETVDTGVETFRGAEAGASERFTIGERLGGRYLVRRCIGEGGMGTVYLAVDEALGTEVALKVVRRDRGAGGSNGLDVLRDEVRLAQRVTHPNVCRTYDLEQLDGRWLIKMEYVHGQTLGDRLAAAGQLAPDEAITVARGVIAGLAAAHAIGVVHRDLKPQNIMLEEGTGRVVLMDFGIAHAEGSAADGLAGTPEYMAPEQVHGGAVDGRADQYALGCVLYRMLVGDVPFRAESRLAIAERQIHDAPPDPARARPELPSWLSAIVLRLLQKDPARRFASLGELSRALGGPDAPPPPPSRARAAAIAVGVAAVVAAVVVAVRARAPEWRPAIREHAPAYEENSDAADISPDGTRVAYPSDRDGTWRIYVGALAGGPSQPVTPREPARLNYPHWTRDGGAIIYRSRKEGVYIVERVALADGTVTELADGASEADDCGGGRLVVVRVSAPDCAECGRVVVRTADGRERELYRTPPGDRVRWARCDRAGTRVVFGRMSASATFQNRAALYLADLDGATVRQIVDDSTENDYPFVHPDGRSVLFSSGRGGSGENIWELSLGDGKLRQITSGNFDCAPVVTPDGTTLLYNSDTTSLPIFAYGAGDGSRRQVTHTLADFEWPVASADGREIFSAARQGGKTEVRAVALADGVERSLGAGDTPALSDDEATVWLSVRDGEGARIVTMPRAGGERREVARLPGAVRRLVRGGDGAMHASVTRADGAESWRIADGEPPRKEAPSPYVLVVPAPAGGWRFAELQRGAVSELELIAPGAVLGAGANRRVRLRGAVWQSDGRALVAWDGNALVRLGVDGTAAPLRKTIDFAGLALSSDGQTVYGAEVIGHVRRELVVNFAARPRN